MSANDFLLSSRVLDYIVLVTFRNGPTSLTIFKLYNLVCVVPILNIIVLEYLNMDCL